MRRIAELDGLRGVAAITIVVYHLLQDRLPLGWAAVDVFFVLSGFLITNILLAHDLSRRFLASFYARRGLRIWPIYYIVILVLVLAGMHESAALPFYLTYTQQVPLYLGVRMPSWELFQHTWTLALEEQFYLIWPAIVFLVGRRWTGPMALSLAAVAILGRMGGMNWWLLASRCDGFALGGLLAAIMTEPDADLARRRAMGWAVAMGAIGVSLAALKATRQNLFHSGEVMIGMSVTLVSLGSFILVALLVCHSRHRLLAPLRNRVLVYLGTISYGIYLYHYPVLKICGQFGEVAGLGNGPILWAMVGFSTLVVAMTSWQLIERPILRLKDRLPYDRVSAAPSVGPSSPSAFQPGDGLSPSVA